MLPIAAEVIALVAASRMSIRTFAVTKKTRIAWRSEIVKVSVGGLCRSLFTVYDTGQAEAQREQD